MRTLALAALALVAAPIQAQHAHPDSARLVADDVLRFWEAYDAAAPDFAADTFQRLYFDRGTPALAQFNASARRVAREVALRPGYYAAARAATLRVGEAEPAVREAFRAMERLYPAAVFPDVYVVVGWMNSGGTVSPDAILIGAEMYALTPEAPLDELTDWHREAVRPPGALPHLVAHELVHFQQAYPDTSRTLLAQSLREGVADLVAEWISGRHTNGPVHAWAAGREAELWAEFREQMHGRDFTGWLYGSNRVEGRPTDLGYWIGYQIARAYYDRAADKPQAVADLLTIPDFAAFLDASGYAERFR